MGCGSWRFARPLGQAERVPVEREDAERDLTLVGVVGLLDPPRPEVSAAIARAHRAGLTIHVVTGDNGATAAEIARQVGIGSGDAGCRVVSGEELAAMTDAELESLAGLGL